MPIVLANEDGSYVEPHKTSRASLWVLSDEFTPDQISAVLGLSPDRWHVRGGFGVQPPETRWRQSHPNPHHAWTLDSRLPETSAPEDHIADLLDRIGDRADAVASLASDPRMHSVRLWVVLRIDNANPGIELPAVLIARLASIGTNLAVDVYVDLEDDSPPEERDQSRAVG
jgi:hypothetical protein